MGLTYKHRTDIANNDTDITNLQNGKNFINVITMDGGIWTNQPAALTEFLGNAELRVAVDLTNVTQYRLMINLVTTNVDNASAELGVQYSTDSGSNWFGLDNGTADTISTVNVDINAATGFITMAFTDIVTAGKADVLIRVVGLVSGGAGTGDPDFVKVEIQFK